MDGDGYYFDGKDDGLVLPIEFSSLFSSDFTFDFILNLISLQEKCAFYHKFQTGVWTA